MEAEGHEESESEEALPFLPDDVLLQVFQHLSQPELFAARVVCRRWADLALHPHVWRNCELPRTGRGQKSKMGILRAALELAPRARSLALPEVSIPSLRQSSPNSSIFDDGGLLAKLAFKTRCAIESLDICIDVSGRHVETVARILENQAKLRRTRKLNLSVNWGRVSEAPLGERWKNLLTALCSLEDLTELCLNVNTTENFDLAWLPALVTPNKSSLKTLSCDFTNTTWAVFMGRLMEWHAPTLESVRLSGTCDEGSVGLPPGCWSDSLARTVRLRKLDCPMLPNMAESFLQCTELQTLTLRFEPDFRRHSAVWREARKYLREAKGLRRLSILRWATNCEVDYGLTAEPAVDLVEALTYSSQPTLEVLNCSVGSFSQGNLELLDRLSAVVLGHLPALRVLRVNPGDGLAMLRLLDRLSRAPRTLTVGLHSFHPDEFCVHEWVVEEEVRVKACFDRNPGLHIEHPGFGYCWVVCQTEKVAGGKPNMVLYGHPDDVRCDHSQPDMDYSRHSLSGGVEGLQAAQ